MMPTAGWYLYVDVGQRSDQWPFDPYGWIFKAERKVICEHVGELLNLQYDLKSAYVYPAEEMAEQVAEADRWIEFHLEDRGGDLQELAHSALYFASMLAAHADPEPNHREISRRADVAASEPPTDNATRPAPAIDVPLTSDHERILAVLGITPRKCMTVIEASSVGTIRDRGTVGRLLAELAGFGMVVRPHGKRKGYALTDAGRKRLLSATPT